MAVKRRWIFGSNDLGDFLSCEKCGHKLSAKQVIFAKQNYNVCPWCESEMEMDQNDVDRMKEGLNLVGGGSIG